MCIAMMGVTLPHLVALKLRPTLNVRPRELNISLLYIDVELYLVERQQLYKLHI